MSARISRKEIHYVLFKKHKRFQGAYLVLGLVALGFTLISVFTLSGPGPLSLLRRQVNEVA